MGCRSRWSELMLPTRPKPRYGFALARVEQGILLFGGENATGEVRRPCNEDV